MRNKAHKLNELFFAVFSAKLCLVRSVARKLASGSPSERTPLPIVFSLEVVIICLWCFTKATYRMLTLQCFPRCSFNSPFFRRLFHTRESDFLIQFVNEFARLIAELSNFKVDDTKDKFHTVNMCMFSASRYSLCRFLWRSQRQSCKIII